MTVREIALKLLLEYETGGKYVNLSLSSPMLSGLSPKDRAQLTVLFYTAVERKLKYDYYIAAFAKRSIDKIDIQTRNILRLGICQLLDISSIPDFAAVSETVKLARHKGERAFINGILRAIARAREDGKLPRPEREKDEARYLSVEYSFPKPVVKHFISLFGGDGAEAILSSFNTRRSLDITVNTLKISRDEYLGLLNKSGVSAAPSALSSLSVRIDTAIPPRELPGFSDGLFFVQDEACAVSAEVLGTSRGDAVIDVCSAPGGKSFAAAILSHDEGRVTSFDIHDSKLSLIESGRDRLGFSSLSCAVRDAREPDSTLFGLYDRVICDVPCSGLGVLGKKPDLRYKDISDGDLPALQYEILEKSFNYLRPCGTLVYSTCTLDPRENEEVAARFLSEHKDAASSDFTVGGRTSTHGCMTLLPHVDGTDGFFIAKFVKRENL